MIDPSLGARSHRAKVEMEGKKITEKNEKHQRKFSLLPPLSSDVNEPLDLTAQLLP